MSDKNISTSRTAIYFQGWGQIMKKKNSNLSSDTPDFTSPPPDLGQDCMQSRVMDMCANSKSCMAAPPPLARSRYCQSFCKDSILFHHKLVINTRDCNL